MNTTLVKSKDKKNQPLSAQDIEKIKAHFAKKAEEARAFLKANPVPKELLKK
ncbi:hypothetical protein L0663_03950 [Dyadobacter sp. CY107]|uniref:hypothetical protein n=1 Tax=Dyadobacter fanqingshengii TaxID=2906443 RepID=UPI001F249014|nr:hypothetical protein [Dyadobacter fanqingshengii]MCF2502517.1 hypothetical protein [Dyadobacter fanqingshengii]